MKFNHSNNQLLSDPTKTRVIACATVIEEMQPLMPAGMTCETLDFGLHVRPETLKLKLQQAVDDVDPLIKYIVLGYGLCSQAVVGLRSEHCTLIVPKIDDCIGIFMGSDSAYRQQSRLEPGTYYLTKGWLEAGNTPFEEHNKLIERYGLKKADMITSKILKNYTRLALINTGHYEIENYRQKAKNYANRFKLRYEEISGSLFLIQKMINGPWDNDFIIADPGRAITFVDFRPDD
jgi:hypothetical protein